MLEKAPAVSVVHRPRGRPDSQLVFVCGDETGHQRPKGQVANARKELLELLPHLVDGARSRLDEIVFAKSFAPILRIGAGHDAADAVDLELAASVEQNQPSLRLDELAGVELVFQAVDVIKDTGNELARGVLQGSGDVVAAATRSH